MNWTEETVLMQHLLLLTDEVFAEIALELQFSTCRQDISLKQQHCVDCNLFTHKSNLEKSWPVLWCSDGTCQGGWTDIYLRGREATGVGPFRTRLVPSLTRSRSPLQGSHKPIIFSCVIQHLLLPWRATLNIDGQDSTSACLPPSSLCEFLSKQTGRQVSNGLCSQNTGIKWRMIGVFKSQSISPWWKRSAGALMTRVYVIAPVWNEFWVSAAQCGRNKW